MSVELGGENETSPIVTKAKNRLTERILEVGYDNDPIPSGGQNTGQFKFSKLSKGKKTMLILFTLANIIAGSNVSLLGAVYAVEAQRKGLTLTMIGFVFSIYQLVVFLASPIIGNFMTRVGVKFVYLSGIFVRGCCVILFGLLDKGPDGVAFFAMSLSVRFVEALGLVGFVNACLTIASNEFPDHVGSVLALLETGWGLGYMLSPVIAGVLYEVGGYGLPFYCNGVLILLNGAMIFKFLPELHYGDCKTVQTRSYLNLLRSPLVLFSMLVVFVVFVGSTVVSSTLSGYLQQFDISASGVGAIYAIPGSTFLIMTVVAGYITDVKAQHSRLIIFGFFLGCLSWFLNGPSPFLPFITASLWSIGVCLVVHGTSFGCIQVPAMKCMLDGTMELNYEKNADTCALVSGLYNSAYALGGLTGPIVGGALIEHRGYPNGYSVFGLINLVMFIFAVVFFWFRKHRKERQCNGTQMM